MAIISNINDLFSVDSTGAIEFNEQVGTSGYSLESRGAGAPPVWTDRDTGKVTGSGTLNKVARWTATGSDIGDGPITFSGATTTANSTFGGNIALTSPKFIAWNGGSTTSMTIGRNYINFTVPAGESSIYGDTDSSLIMSTENGGDSLLIDIDGNVGLAPNTATGLPAYKLDVGGTIRANGNVIALDAEFTNEVTIKQTSASAGFSGKLFIEGTDVPKIQLKNLDQQTSIDQILGTLEFYGSDASTGNAAGVRASITANTGFVSGGTTARDQGCLEFATYNGSDFSGAPRQHLKITPDGGFSFGLTSTAYGTSGQVLTSAGDAPPTWTTPTTGTVKGTGTATRVAFWSASDTITSDADLYWDNTNKRLGIGVSSPAALLEINGTGDAIRVESTNTGAGGAQIDLLHYSTSPADDDTMAYINMGGYYNTTPSQAYFSSIRTVATDISARQGELTFWTVNTTLQQRMVIDTDGNVGINETSPDAKLHVMGATGLPATSGTTFTGTMRLGVSGYGTVMDFGAVGPATGTQWIQVTDASNQAIQYPLLLQPNGGNVGIGTNSPTAKLEVRRYSGDRTTLSTIISVTNEGSGPYTGFGGKISFNSNIYYGATTPGLIETAYVGAVLGTSYETTSDLVFATRVSATSVTEKMRILGNGNVLKPKSSAFSASTTTPGFSVGTTEVKIAYDTENVDTNGNYDTTNYRFTAPVTGNYLIGTTNSCYISTGVTVYMAVYIRKNGVATSYRFRGGGVDNDVNDWFGISGSVVVPLAAGDYIELWGYANAGSFQIVNTEGHFYGYLIG